MASQVIGQAGFSCMLESDLSGADGPFDFPILTHYEMAGMGVLTTVTRYAELFQMLTCGQSPEKC